MRKKQVGYTFIKHEYDSSDLNNSIHGAEVTFNIRNQDITWHELVEEFSNFVRGCGFQPPKGELVWLDDSEIVCTKAESVLYNK